MSQNKTIVIIIALLLMALGAFMGVYSVETPIIPVFIFLCGAILYPVLVYIQRAGGRERLDYIHTGEAAVLLLISVPVIIHSDGWFSLTALLIPASFAVTWLFRVILNPYSRETAYYGTGINLVACLLFLLMVYLWEVDPAIIEKILTGPARYTSPSTVSVAGLYTVMLLLAAPAAMLHQRFRLMSQGQSFYNSMRDDYTVVYLASLFLEALLLLLILLTIGILGMGLRYLIKPKEEPAMIIILFLLSVTATQLFLAGTTYTNAINIAVPVIMLSYAFYFLRRGRIYLW